MNGPYLRQLKKMGTIALFYDYNYILWLFLHNLVSVCDSCTIWFDWYVTWRKQHR